MRAPPSWWAIAPEESGAGSDDALGRHPGRRRGLALLAGEHSGIVRSSCCRSPRASRCSRTRWRASRRSCRSSARSCSRTRDWCEPIAALAPSLPRENLIAEPRPAGTAAALAWAAHDIARRGGAGRRDDQRPRRLGDRRRGRIPDCAAHAARDAAETHRALVTVGVVPVRADPGLRVHPARRGMGSTAVRVASRASSRSRIARAPR